MNLNYLTPFLLSVLLIFITCGKPERKNTTTIPKSSSKDVIEKKYLPIDIDTTEKVIRLSMYNEPYSLKIKRYCLNDSSVINEAGIKGALNISHNYAFRIILVKANKVVLSKQVNKETFKDSLNAQLYTAELLRNVQYDFVRTNRLYFKAMITNPQTNQNDEIQFAVFYKTNRIGELNFWRGMIDNASH